MQQAGKSGQRATRPIIESFRQILNRWRSRREQPLPGVEPKITSSHLSIKTIGRILDFSKEKGTISHAASPFTSCITLGCDASRIGHSPKTLPAGAVQLNLRLPLLK